MIVCHCRVVSHRDIDAAVQGGARSIDEVSDICGAGTDCGGCLPVLADAVARHTGEPAEVPCALRRRTIAAA